MNDHDDEVTTDVDPEWIAAIRAETATVSSDTTRSDDTSNGVDESEPAAQAGSTDWFDTELKWDAEATVGVSAGLIDRIRSEIDTERRSDTPAPPPPSVDPSPAPATTPEVVTAAPVEPAPIAAAPGPPAPPPVLAPPTPPVRSPVPVTAVEEAVSTTVRWEPRQRLAMAAPVKESAAIVDDSRHTGLDRTKVAIAVIVAVTVLLVVWLVSRSGGSDDPAPDGTVPAASTPATSAPGLVDESNGGG